MNIRTFLLSNVITFGLTVAICKVEANPTYGIGFLIAFVGVIAFLVASED